MNDMVPVNPKDARLLMPQDEAALPAQPISMAEKTLAAPMDRRSFLGRVRDGAATTLGVGAGAGGVFAGYKAYGAFTAPRQVEVAMLRLDATLNHDGSVNNDQRAFCLDHRVATERDPNDKQAKDTEQQIDVSSNQLSLRPDGQEALTLAPDLMIKANNSEPNNIGGHEVTLANAPKDLFIPFQLLENAQSARFAYNEKGKLTLTITSFPIEKPVTLTEQASAMAETARRSAACATEQSANAMKGWVPDAIAGYLPESVTARNPEQDCKPLPEKPKEYLTSTSTITLEGADKLHLPSIHLYDTRRFNADYHLSPMELHERIFKGQGDLLASTISGKSNAELIAGAATRSFNDSKLQHDFEATRLGVNSQFSNSLVEQLASFTKNWDFNPEGLSTPERHTLNMAVDFKQREFENKPWREKATIRVEDALGIASR